MLLVGTQPLHSQHPPLTPLPLSSAMPRKKGNKPGRCADTRPLRRELKRGQDGFRLDVRLSDEMCRLRERCPCCSGSTEERREAVRALRCVPSLSRRFLSRPHCVLLPLYLSGPHQPPPAPHQTAALAVFCCSTHIESDSNPDAIINLLTLVLVSGPA